MGKARKHRRYTADKLRAVYNAIADIIGGNVLANVVNGKLPAPPVAMRIAWELPNVAIDSDTFGVASSVGTTNETLSPPYPQAFRDMGVNSAILIFWAATDLDPAALPLDTGDVGRLVPP